MILFLVNTSTQLMNTIVLSRTIYKEYRCDIYYTDNLKEYIEKANNHKVFNCCYQITLPRDVLNRRSVINRAIVRVKNAIDIKSIKRDLPSDPGIYEKVLLSGQSLRNIEFYYAIKDLNHNVHLGLYEEGAFEYCMLGIKKSWSKVLFSKLFFRRYYLEECEDAFLYEPTLVNNIWTNIKIKGIPQFSDDHELKEILNNVFSYKRTILDGKRGKIVFIEQAFFDQERDDQQVALINEIISEIGQKDVFVKMHPRSKIGKYNLSRDSLIGGTPLELMIMNENIEDNIFISITSSATTNFKVIFNEEPIIIMLYKLFLSHSIVSHENEEFISRVKNICNNNTFFIPESTKEFKTLLLNLMKANK